MFRKSHSVSFVWHQIRVRPCRGGIPKKASLYNTHYINVDLQCLQDAVHDQENSETRSWFGHTLLHDKFTASITECLFPPLSASMFLTLRRSSPFLFRGSRPLCPSLLLSISYEDDLKLLQHVSLTLGSLVSGSSSLSFRASFWHRKTRFQNMGLELLHVSPGCEQTRNLVSHALL